MTMNGRTWTFAAATVRNGTRGLSAISNRGWCTSHGDAAVAAKETTDSSARGIRSARVLGSQSLVSVSRTRAAIRDETTGEVAGRTGSATDAICVTLGSDHER